MNVRDSKSDLRFHISSRYPLHQCVHTATISDHKSSIPRSRFMSPARDKRWLYLAVKMALTSGNNVSVKRCKWSNNEICVCSSHLSKETPPHKGFLRAPKEDTRQHYRTNTRLQFILLTGWIYSLMWSSPKELENVTHLIYPRNASSTS